MKNIFSLFLALILLLSVFSCKEDDSLAISQDQLLRGNKWQLKQTIKVSGNKNIVDKLLACERQSTLDFRDVEKYYAVSYKTVEGKCVEEQEEGNYVYVTSKDKRTLTMTPVNGDVKEYYMYEINPKSLIIQKEFMENDSVKYMRYVYQSMQ
ncbi:lipocalin family protein [Empedobacter tilapiae]|uniref:lipocalin family protein n=1 Tax=Empedobacter tilapiae TaxID=2491114 RepID=UPI0028D7623B|nr:lipocalin family protein [Empedobacter tilapiae]